MTEKLPVNTEDIQEHCDVCQRTQETSPATHKCIQCSEYLCATCSKVHRGSKATSNHMLVTVQDIAAGKLEQLTVALPKCCITHPTEDIKFYCHTCNLILCRDCIVIKHNKHNCVDINEAFTNQKNVINEEVRDLNNAINFEVLWTDLLAKQEKHIKGTCNGLQAEILAKRDTIIDKINQHTAALVDKVDNYYNNESEMLSKEINKTQKQLKTLQNTKQHADNVLKHGHDSHKVGLGQEVADKLSQYKTAVTDRHTTLTDMKFTGSDKIDGTTGNYGAVSNTDPHIILSYQFLSPEELNILAKVKPIDIKPSYINEINVRVEENENTPDITGIAVHPVTGDIIAADYKNHKLKTFTRAGTLKSQVSKGEGYQLNRPWDVTVLHDGIIAVTNSWTDEVIVLSPDYTMISNFTSSCCKGIAELNDGTIAISCTSTRNEIVEFRSVYGTTMKPPLKLDNMDFPYYVAVTPDDRLIISDDQFSHTIHIYDKNKVLLHQYGEQGSGDGQLNHPRGVCIDKLGNIIAADRDNNRLQMLSLQGKFIRDLVTSEHGLCKPQAVAINREGHILVSEEGKDKIKVFKYLAI